MSEPTSGGSEKPGSEPDKDAEPDREITDDDVQDQSSVSVFNDPTAPVWADPTAPMPGQPTPPGATAPQIDQTAASLQQTHPVDPTPSNPYAQQPPQPQGQQPPPPPPYGQQQPYGQPQPGQQYPAYGQQAYGTGAPTETNTSAIVLTVLSGISIFVGNVLAIGSLILGIVSLNRNTTDHEGSRHLTKIGWIVFAATWVVGILVGIALIIALAVAFSHGDPNTSFGN